MQRKDEDDTKFPFAFIELKRLSTKRYDIFNPDKPIKNGANSTTQIAAIKDDINKLRFLRECVKKKLY